jgi:hypothetical protein
MLCNTFATDYLCQQQIYMWNKWTQRPKKYAKLQRNNLVYTFPLLHLYSTD